MEPIIQKNIPIIVQIDKHIAYIIFSFSLVLILSLEILYLLVFNRGYTLNFQMNISFIFKMILIFTQVPRQQL